MDRQLLDALWARSPRLALARLRRGPALDIAAQAFLLDHLDEDHLDTETLIAVLELPSALDGEELRQRPFITRLAALLPTADLSTLLRALALANHLEKDAWADLTIRLRGRFLEPWKWFRFVDRVRGGTVFDALNVAPRLPPDIVEFDCWGHPPYFLRDEERRAEPLVAALLEDRYDDSACRAFVLKLPLKQVFDVHRRNPSAIPLNQVFQVAEARLDDSEDQWPMPPPSGTNRLALERARRGATDDEARAILCWLANDAASDRDELLLVAVDRCRARPYERIWHEWLGGALSTGTAWRKHGRSVLDVYLALNDGFPFTLLNTALTRAGVEEHRIGLLRPAHDALARALVDRADAAVMRGEHECAMNALTALASLDPGAFISPRIHGLRRKPNLPAEVLDLLDTLERLFKRGSGRSPSAEGLCEAFEILKGGGS